MKINNMKELKDVAIACDTPIRVYSKQFNKEEIFHPFTRQILEKSYETCNKIIAFVSESILYVIPYTRKTMDILINAGFSHKSMYVPFSNGDYPIQEELHWNTLKKKAHEELICEFSSDCEKFSDEHGFAVLAESLMAKCFEIPLDGVQIQYRRSKSIYYPEITELCLNRIAVNKIGHYHISNGTCVFVYRNGKTYVTRSGEVVMALCKGGYTEIPLFVPFSSEETIIDPIYAEQWKKAIS